MDNLVINKVWNEPPKRNNPSRQQFKSKQTGGSNQARARGPFCPACYYLGQQLQTTIHTRHLPTDCPRKTMAVNMLKMEDDQHFEENRNDIGSKPSSINHHYQEVTKNSAQEGTQYDDNKVQSSDYQESAHVNITSYQRNDDCIYNPDNSDTNALINTAADRTKNYAVSDKQQSDTPLNEQQNLESLILAVYKLGSRKVKEQQNPVRKERSPVVAVTIHNRPALATIDEGSEINCLDETFAIRSNILFIPTNCKALAAGKSEMKLVGQTLNDVRLTLQNTDKSIVWDLGKTVVVSNLGVDILIGEPGKADNRISTIPHKKIIEVMGFDNKKIRLPYFSKIPSSTTYTTCRSTKRITLYPGEILNQPLPLEMHSAKYVSIAPKRRDDLSWIQPRILKVQDDGNIQIENRSNQIINLNKHDHIADVRSCLETTKSTCDSPDAIRKLFDLNTEDISHLIPDNDIYEGNECFLEQISIDPDHQLSFTWRQKFKELCHDFSDIINPRPGKYNGYFGRVDNSINFATTPPPTIRSHLPKYSHEMLSIMANKMDKLESWGVLRKPEDLGVVPEFVLPSMLTPKTEKGEWRLVTDFTPLNIHIKKLEVVSPTIEEAKEKLAKFRYHVQLDLSNYFYQGGMKVEDIQYLATPHPFKGLRVYTCEPQGLKNASEHAYERLARIYGDLCGSEKMTRMADGLFILGQTVDELFENFQEVLSRARLCGLTFKPSKIVIAPVNTILFGWQKIGDGWRPTPHTISPLASALPPTTV